LSLTQDFSVACLLETRTGRYLSSKLITVSDKPGRADELYESETSGPVSGRTRKRIQKKKREASRLSNRNDDDRPGRSGDDANGNVQKYVTNDKPTNCRYLGVRPFN